MTVKINNKFQKSKIDEIDYCENISFNSLTAAEHNVMFWLAQGKTVSETAIILEKSCHTVLNQVRSIRSRMNGLPLRICVVNYSKFLFMREFRNDK